MEEENKSLIPRLSEAFPPGSGSRFRSEVHDKLRGVNVVDLPVRYRQI